MQLETSFKVWLSTMKFRHFDDATVSDPDFWSLIFLMISVMILWWIRAFNVILSVGDCDKVVTLVIHVFIYTLGRAGDNMYRWFSVTRICQISQNWTWEAGIHTVKCDEAIDHFVVRWNAAKRLKIAFLTFSPPTALTRSLVWCKIISRVMQQHGSDKKDITSFYYTILRS